MITVYNSNEIDFSHNGLATLKPTMCVVSEELNGLYDMELEHTYDKEKRWEKILEGNVIKAPAPKGDQLFRIFKKKKTLTGIRINARHIFYDLLKNLLEDVRPTSLTGATAIDWVLTRTQYPHRFTGISDITVSNSASYVRINPVKALIGDQENSFLNRWGGELERDNFNIRINQAIGLDRGVTIRYGKNLVGVDCEVDIDSVITRVMPTGLTADDQILILPEKYIDSPLIAAYEDPKIQEYHFQDIKVSDELTTEQAYELLRQKAAELFSKHQIDIPPSSTAVDFIELSTTEEYQDYQVLERVYLGDIVTIKHTQIGIDLKQKVVKYKWNALLEKYIKIELGDFKDNLTSSFNQINRVLTAISEQIKTNKSDLQLAIDNATALLTSALGGYVVKRNGELLIMDTEDPMTATRIWRWNLNGLGYSSTGINGPYPTAITMDGAIVADFITTGVLDANLIKTGSIESIDGTTSISLSDGSVTVKQKTGEDFTGSAKINSQGFTLYDANNNVRAYFGQNDKAFIKQIETDDIFCPTIIKCTALSNVNIDLYVAPNITGDGSGRDVNNKCNSINTAIINAIGQAKYLRNVNITVNLAAGTYSEFINLTGYIGDGSINIIGSGYTNTLISGRMFVKNCSVKVWVYNLCFIYADMGVTSLAGFETAIFIKNSNCVAIQDCRAIFDATNPTNYGGNFLTAVDGSSATVKGCDVVGWWHFIWAHSHSHVRCWVNRGNVHWNFVGREGSSVGTQYEAPNFIDGWWSMDYNSNSVDSISQATDSAWYPPAAPPPPAYVWRRFETTFNAQDYRSVRGSETQWGEFKQGNWGSYSRWQGQAYIPNVANWCSGAQNIQMSLLIQRKSTQHGAYGEIPRPHIALTQGASDGRYWDSGVAFALGQQKWVGLTPEIVSNLASGVMWDIYLQPHSDQNMYMQCETNMVLWVSAEKYVPA